MEQLNNFLLAAITVLAGVVGYLLKKTYDKVDTIGSDVAEIKPKVEILWSSVAEMNSKIDILWRDALALAESPRQLNERGQRILGESGIKAIVDEKYQELLSRIKAETPTNAYDAEQLIIDVMNKLPEKDPDLVPRLKDGAFRSGEDIQAVLFAGSLYLRNRAFPDLGFAIEH